MRFQTCEFCENWDFQNVNFVKIEISKMWILWKLGVLKYDFLDQTWIFASVWFCIWILVLKIYSLLAIDFELASTSNWTKAKGKPIVAARIPRMEDHPHLHALWMLWMIRGSWLQALEHPASAGNFLGIAGIIEGFHSLVHLYFFSQTKNQ